MNSESWYARLTIGSLAQARASHGGASTASTIAGAQCAGGSALSDLDRGSSRRDARRPRRTPRESAPARASRRARSMSRTSISMRTRLGTLLTAPGNTSQTPTVPTVSIGAGRARRGFDGQRHLRRGQKRVVPLGHQHRAGVAALAFDDDPQAGRRRDRRHHADVACPLAPAAAPARCAARRRPRRHPGQTRTCASGRVKPAARPRPRPASGRRASRKRARRAASASPHSSRLPRQPMPKRVGSSEVNSMQLDRPPRLNAGAPAARGSPPARRARPRCRRSARRWGWRRCASRWPPAGRSGSVPAQRAKMLPTASSRTSSRRLAQSSFK